MAGSPKCRNAIVCSAALALTLLIAVVPASARGQDSPAPDRQAAAAEQVIEGQYIVVYEDSAGPVNTATARHEEKLGFQSELRYRHAVSGFAAELTPGQVHALKRDPDVAFVSEDRRVSAVADVQLAAGEEAPTGVRRVLAATDTTAREASGVGVAVIDTGVQPDHPDLTVREGTDCVETKPSARGEDGHGTHVAGTIAANNNGTGVVGVAPGTIVHDVRVLDENGEGYWSWLICGIDWVTANAESLGIGVANMSLGGGDSSIGSCTTNALRIAICRSTDAGIHYVVAAGNSARGFDDGTSDAGFAVPAAYPEVLTVTAIADSDGLPGGIAGSSGCGDDRPASFSNFASTQAGAKHTIAAPGVCILSTWPGSGYETLSGTSMAAPHVAGLVALCLDEAATSGPCAGMSPAEVTAWMRADAESYTTADKTFGFLNDPLHDPITCPEPQHYGFLSVMPGSNLTPAPASSMPTSTCESDEPESSSEDPEPVTTEPAPAPPPEESPPPDEAADEVPLESTITIATRNLRLRAERPRLRVKFRFTASTPEARFRCAIDRRKFKRCSSPFKARVKAGKHKLRLKTKAGDERVRTVKRFKVRRAKR